MKKGKYDLVNVGSSQLLFGLDYADCNIKADNWAAYPQYFDYDYAVLKQFSNHINKGATILLPVCLMEFFFGGGMAQRDIYQYYPVINRKYLSYYKLKQYIYARYPLLRHPKLLKYLIRDIDWEFRGYDVEKNPCVSIDDFNKDAQGFIQRWNSGFGTNIPSLNLTDEQKKNIQRNVKVLREMVQYCKKQGWKPVFLILPCTKYLIDYFSEEFIEECVVSKLKSADAAVPILNYIDCEEFMKDEYYMNSFFMNAKGRRIMAKRVVNDALKL